MQLRLLILFFSIFGFIAYCNAQVLEPDLESAIDEQFARYNAETPGMAISIIKDGETVFRKGYGSADLEHGIMIDPATSVFNLASVSKQFTVLAIMLLAEEGKLSLDDEVRQHLSELPDYGERISLRQLAGNTSGVRGDLELMGMAGYTNDDLITDEMTRAMTYRQKELNFTPGDEFLYSNSNFGLLAEIVEKVSGMPFSVFMQQRVFAPLGMMNTFVMDDHQRLVPNRAYCYGMQDGNYVNDYLHMTVVGSTGIYTTLDDFARWAQNFRDAKVGNSRIFEQMRTPTLLNDGRATPYALGQFVGQYNGHTRVYHAGGNASYRSHISRFPDEDLTILLLSNDGPIYIEGEMDRIADLLLTTSSAPKASNQENAPSVSLTQAEMEAVTGNYLHKTDYYVRNIQMRHDSLFYRRTEQENRESNLRPLGNGRFELMVSGPPLFVEFSRGQMRVFTDSDDVDVFSAITPKTYTEAELKAFEGHYFSEELDASYFLELMDGKLTVRNPRIGTVTLDSAYPAGFLSNTWRFNFLEFERDAEEGVSGFRISSSRVRGVSFRRLGRGRRMQ